MGFCLRTRTFEACRLVALMATTEKNPAT